MRPSNTSDHPSENSCHGNWMPYHPLVFQLGHAVILISYLIPPGLYSVVVMHGLLTIGFGVLIGWGWMCTPDMLSWYCTLALINCIQMFLSINRLLPLKFHPDIEMMYSKLFDPLNVPRHLFKKLVAYDICKVIQLKRREFYATKDITPTDRLALLISGKALVSIDGRTLHHVRSMEFLDSPEYESSGLSEEAIFHVTIQAQTTCWYVCWERRDLEKLFQREPHLAAVMVHLITSDITNKLYTLCSKMYRVFGIYPDIRVTHRRPGALAIPLRPLSNGHIPAEKGSHPLSPDVLEQTQYIDANDDDIEDFDDYTEWTQLCQPRTTYDSVST